MDRLKTGLVVTIFLFLLTVYTAAAAQGEVRTSESERHLRIPHGPFMLGSPGYIPFILDSPGGERQVSFSISWPLGSMRYVRVDRAQGSPTDMQVSVNTSQLAFSRIGITLSSETGFAAGNKRVASLVGFGGGGPQLAVKFVNEPNQLELTGANGERLETTFTGSTLAFGVEDPPTYLTVRDVSGTPGQNVTIPIGFEPAFGGFDGVSSVKFSVQWDPELFDYRSAQIGSFVPQGIAMTLDESLTSSGFLGVSFTGTQPFLNWNQYKIVDLALGVKPNAPIGYHAVSFNETPTPIAGFDAQGQPRNPYWRPGFVKIGEVYGSIQGAVYSPDILAIRNVPVFLTDPYGFRHSVSTTGPFGSYQFYSVPLGHSYTLNVQSKRYRFAPKVVNFSNNLTNLHFIGLE